MPKIAITMGDACGIGAEIILKALKKLESHSNLVLVGNRKIFKKNEILCSLKLPTDIEFIDVDYDISKIQFNGDEKYSGELAYKCLKTACDMANDGYISAIATAPLSKNALHLAGYNYSGQTEILQTELSDGTDKAEMLFVAEQLRILLLTRHIALKDVCKNITEQNIIRTASTLNSELISKFKIKRPSIAMCALNPHAGENGILGDEESSVINPAIDILNKNNVNITKAMSADTLLGDAVKNYKNPVFNAYISCYHDQALCAVKSLGLDKILNITIGLKVLRSSPSHGTAYDIAYQNKADYTSMLNAIEFFQK